MAPLCLGLPPTVRCVLPNHLSHAAVPAAAATLPAVATSTAAAAVTAATMPSAAVNPSAVDTASPPYAAAALTADAATTAAPAVIAASGEGNDRANLFSTPPAADPVAAVTPPCSGTCAAADPQPTDSIAQADPTVVPTPAIRVTRHARTPVARHSSCSAGTVLPDSSASGIWLLLEDAATYLGVPYQSDRQFRKSSELDTSRHIERGASVSKAAPFSSFDYVCVLKDAPPGWCASANTRLKLPDFLRLCSHLSITSTSPPGSEIALNFSRYTGRTFTPRNVMSAFDDRVKGQPRTTFSSSTKTRSIRRT